MIPLLTREAVRAMDADAVARLGLPSLVLMENAGVGATRVLLDRFADRLGRVVLVGGPGQNGGDAWVVARQLCNHRVTPVAVLLGDEASVRGDAAVNLAVLRALGAQVHVVSLADAGALGDHLEGASLVVDGIFGTGLDRSVSGGWASAVEAINGCGVPVVALDVPSGIDANTGAVLGTAVRARVTVTFAAHKRGLVQHPGADHAGEVVCVNIGVPGPDAGAPLGLLEPADAGRALGQRAAASHKGTAGHVLLVAGSPGRTGAAVLAGLGALRAGAGLVTIAADAQTRGALDHKVVELMTESLPDGPGQALSRALTLAEGKAAVALGPGVGLDDRARELMLGLAEHLECPAVLDADALTVLAGAGLDCLRKARGSRVLTPHPGEAARLLGCTIGGVQADRFDAASRLAGVTGAVVVLKGSRTVVWAPDGRGRVCPRGTPALGTAGTGDVLTGAVAALLAGREPLEAASVAVMIHALAGELAARSDRGLLAHEVADALPAAIEACRAALR